MPRVKIDYIVSFSSEDPNNPASNLLGWDVSKRRWLCPKGEPSCSVVLQLTKAVKMSAVHIGAHQAALVEVLVGRSETPNEPFQVLVPSCVFLSPSESRKGDSIERVRSFTLTQLTDARHQRWDRMRIVCSQPYNKHCMYGLNFVHVDEFETTESVPAPEVRSLRLHAASGHSSDEDEFRPGELFKKHRLSNDPTIQNTDTGAQIRQATSQALRNITDSATKLVKTPITKQNKRQTGAEGDYGSNRQRDSLMYTDDDDKPHAKIDHIVQRHKDESSKDNKHTARLNDSRTHDNNSDKSKRNKTDDRHEDRHSNKVDRNRTCEKRDNKNSDKVKTNDNHELKNIFNLNKQVQDLQKGSNTPKGGDKRDEDRNSKPSHSNEDVNNGASTSSNGLPSSNKRPREQKRKNEKVEVGSILSGVTLVFSGYVNPERADLRALALSMGARCRSDWGPDCTHLICAFPNTPKLRAARATAGGPVRAVRSAWLRECRRRGRPLPWTHYATDPAHATDDHDNDDDNDNDNDHHTDEDDTDDEIQKVMHQAKRARNSPIATLSPPADRTSNLELSSSSDVTFVKDERIKARVTISDSDGGTTDEDTALLPSPAPDRIDPSNSLPAIFDGRTFVIAADAAEPSLLRRYVLAYGGLVLQESEIDEESVVDYVICSEPDKVSSEAAASTSAGPGASTSAGPGASTSAGPGASTSAGPGAARPVSPGWLWRCHRQRKLLPT